LTEHLLHNEQELLSQIASGDQQAFADLYLGYYDKIYSVSLMYLKVHELAEDTTQQVFLKLWEKRATITKVTNIESYLFITARNEIFNIFRKQNVQESHRAFVLELFSQEPGSPEELLIVRQKAMLMDSIVRSLPDRQQQAFRLSREKGLPYKEIAETMNISVATVKEHIGNATRQIRELLLANKEEFLALFLAIIASQ
jgi:RNA polymerase sigma-70 factor (family 1)